MSVDSYKAEGNTLFSEQRFTEAVEAYSKAIALDGSNAILFSNRSAAHLCAVNPAAARLDADSALAADPSFAKGYLRKSKATKALGRPAHAEKVLKDALKTMPDNAILKAALADFLLEEDGPCTPLDGHLPGTPAQNMRDFQGEQGMQMHHPAFLRNLPSEAHRQAFLGNAAGFRAAFDPAKHANLRCWDLKLPLTTLIVSGAQRIQFVQPSSRHAKLEHDAILLEVVQNGWCRADAKDIAGETALKHACGHHPRLELARVLLEHGADPSIKDRFGSSPIFGSIMGQEVEAVKLLLDAGADPTASDRSGVTVESLSRFHPGMLAMVHAKLNINQQNKDILPTKTCGFCRKAGASRRCSGCISTVYCARDCQRAHWKAHKKVCSKETPGSTAADVDADVAGGSGSNTNSELLTVKVVGAQGEGKLIIPNTKLAESVAKATGMRDGSLASIAEDIQSMANLKMDDECEKNAIKTDFIVKVQVPLNVPPGTQPMLVYNETRSFQANIPCTSPEAKRLDSVVRKSGTMGGIKAYFLAYMPKKGELTLVVNKVLPTQPW